MAATRNIKCIGVPQSFMLDFLRGAWGTRYITIPRLGVIPHDAILLAVEYSFQRQAFIMLIEHPSFPEVNPGEEMKVDMNYLAETIRLKRLGEEGPEYYEAEEVEEGTLKESA